MTAYNLTAVYWSRDPEDFPLENLVCTLPVHAAELIHDEKKDGSLPTRAGIKKGCIWPPSNGKSLNELNPKP